MATGQLYYKVRLSDGSQESSEGITTENFFNNNLVSLVGATRFIKAGIQAPPGTKIVFNDTITVMVGRTGVYEVEAEISSMKIIRLANYVAETQEEVDSKRDGLNAMIAAVEDWYAYLEEIKDLIPESGTSWPIDDNEVLAKEKEFEDAYDEGFSTYIVGYNGIYTQDGYVDVDNIIVDYQYE